jgi:hypothetical protein
LRMTHAIPSSNSTFTGPSRSLGIEAVLAEADATELVIRSLREVEDVIASF